MKYGIGRIRKAGSRWDAEVNVAYQRYRRRCLTLEDAKAFIESVAYCIEDRRRPLTPAEIADIRGALRLLPPGVKMVDVARYYFATNPVGIAAAKAAAEKAAADPATTTTTPSPEN